MIPSTPSVEGMKRVQEILDFSDSCHNEICNGDLTDFPMNLTNQVVKVFLEVDEFQIKGVSKLAKIPREELIQRCVTADESREQHLRSSSLHLHHTVPPNSLNGKELRKCLGR